MDDFRIAFIFLSISFAFISFLNFGKIPNTHSIYLSNSYLKFDDFLLSFKFWTWVQMCHFLKITLIYLYLIIFASGVKNLVFITVLSLILGCGRELDKVSLKIPSCIIEKKEVFYGWQIFIISPNIWRQLQFYHDIIQLR